MQLRSYTLASNILFCLLVTDSAPAQKPVPTPAAGYIRFWDMLPQTNGAFDLRKLGSPATAPALISNVGSYRYSSYIAFPAGAYRLGVFKANDVKAPLKTFDLTLRPDTFFTVLISPGKIDLVNDTVDPKADSGTVTVRNYFPGVTVTVTSGGQTLATLPYGESHESGSMPLTRSSVALSARLPTGIPVQATLEPDFKASKRATVLIIPDLYGRFRPRVTVDGKNI